jgi:hypothetical protein
MQLSADSIIDVPVIYGARLSALRSFSVWDGLVLEI